MKREKTTPTEKVSRRNLGHWKAWIYLLPAMVILITFKIYPIIKSMLMGFYTNFDYLNDIVYAWGIDNFRNIFEDANFLLALKNTSVLVLYAAPLSIAISLLFAVLLNSNIRFQKMFQTIYFLPFVTSMVAASIAWAWLFNRDYGLINAFLGVFGISKTAWLTNPRMTIPILVMISVWKGLGYRVIVFLAALQGIDQKYYQAAMLDGAGRFRRFTQITLPLLGPSLFFLSVTTIIDVFKTFDEVYVMYSNKPGPLNSGLTIVYYIFNKFYRHWEFASAAAAAFVLFLIILLITLLQFSSVRIFKRWHERRVKVE